MSQSSIEYRQICKSYGDTPLLQNLDLKIEAGKTTAIVGESGSGKSTLLQMANGLLRPDSGEVLLQGKALDYENLVPQRLSTGYCVQGAGLFPHLNVFENVTLMARLSGWDAEKVEARFLSLLELLGLPIDFRDRYPYSLSGGQQQRVGLCRAMMLDPALLLLDEPFSALDPITRESIQGEFVNIRETVATSIVLVTHDLLEASRLAHSLIILYQGTVEQVGSFSEVRGNPASEYVAELFQSVSP